jgi:hypothetical protein
MTPAPDDLEILDRDGYLEVRARGPFTLVRMKAMLEQAAAEAVARNTGRLLFDITAVQDYRPSTAERFQLGSHIARLLKTLTRFACLAKAEQIDPDNFTARVATNRGSPAPVFNTRKKAVDWVLGQP